ncbi:MAG: CHAT domain-containing protein [Chloroflexi bacterium]|nr:CHAT domain-containing protein [Chloroflexota bacterium]
MAVLSSGADAAQEIGGRLYDALFANDARAALLRTTQEAREQGKGVQIRLDLEEAPELGDLPWEFLYDRSRELFLNLAEETTVVRSLDAPRAARPLALQLPLRILAVFTSPNNLAPLDIEREWQGLNAALGELTARGLVELQRLEHASLGDLQRMMRRSEIHILHFSGHGGFDIDRGEGFFILEDEKGNGRQVGVQTLGTLLGDWKTLRLLTLMTLQGTRAVTAPLLRIAPALIRQGVPAVVGMRFELSDRAAITFAREFYSALADNYSLDTALAQARKAIYADGNETEWATPVLYTSARDSVIFDVQSIPARPEPAPRVTVSERGSEVDAKSKPARKTKSAKPKTTRAKAPTKTAALERAELEPDTILQNRYRIRKKISESDLSSIYLARDERLGGKQCALKELKTGTDISASRQQELFKQSTEILSRLSHPSLPRVTDYFESEAHFYYIMDFIEGNTLENLLAQNGKPFSVDQVLPWANELCNVLTYLHARTPPFLHGNISPEHILQTTDGSLVLLGFDMFALYPQTEKSGELVGTPGYVAPEQIEGNLTVQCDIYALGVTLYHLLTVYDPAESLFDLPPIRKLNSTVPTHIADALAAAYALDPQQQYASAADFQRALQAPPKNLLDRFLRRA